MVLKKLSGLALSVLSLYVVLSASSCVSYKSVPYFQDLDSAQTSMVASAYHEPTIVKNDLLGIYISSGSETTQTLFGTLPSEASVTTASQNAGSQVDGDGNIYIQTIGKIKAEGLTVIQLGKIIRDEAAKYVNNPTVVVRVLNFKISVIGEVAHAGVFSIPNSKVNVIEALSMAGDLKITGKRENILVIRQAQNGSQLQFARLDLRSKNTFSSPYFYLQNNDQVYVEPSVKRLQLQDNVYRNISIVASVLTVITVVITRLL